MLRVAATALLCTSAYALSTSFETYVRQFGKSFGSENERDKRRAIFHNNVREISRLNEVAAAAPVTTGSGHHPAVFEINEFADQTPEEFQAARRMSNVVLSGNLASRRTMYGGGVWRREPSSDPSSPTTSSTTPDHQDWYLKATTPVRDQGQCGSCWAFSTVEQVESDWYLSGKSGWSTPQELSVQQLLSCDTKGAYGCGGTNPGGGSGFDFVIQNGGLVSDKDYPYVSGKTKETGTCKKGVAPIAGGTIRNYTYAVKPCDLPWDNCDHQDEGTLVDYVGTKGPLSICVNARKWQFYKSGVMDGTTCGGHDPGSMDHCVQLTGYNRTGSYWIVRNSWRYADGRAWGQDGLIFLSMGNNTCGLANVPSFAVV